MKQERKPHKVLMFYKLTNSDFSLCKSNQESWKGGMCFGMNQML